MRPVAAGAISSSCPPSPRLSCASDRFLSFFARSLLCLDAVLAVRAGHAPVPRRLSLRRHHVRADATAAACGAVSLHTLPGRRGQLVSDCPLSRCPVVRAPLTPSPPHPLAPSPLCPLTLPLLLTVQMAEYRIDEVVVKDPWSYWKIYTIREGTLSGQPKEKHFCGNCGCTLWTVAMRDRGELRMVRTSLIENGWVAGETKRDEEREEREELAAGQQLTMTDCNCFRRPRCGSCDRRMGRRARSEFRATTGGASRRKKTETKAKAAGCVLTKQHSLRSLHSKISYLSTVTCSHRRGNSRARLC